MKIIIALVVVYIGAKIYGASVRRECRINARHYEYDVAVQTYTSTIEALRKGGLLTCTREELTECLKNHCTFDAGRHDANL